jgi:hypothetical protein
MLNPYELRIGNWIETSTGVKQVFEVSEDFINGFKTNLTNSKPIHLTNELLKFCGFREKGGIMSKANDAGEFCISWYDDTHKKIWKDNRYFGILPLQYLHQLQNLYFVLMGAEIEVNLFSVVANKQSGFF